MVPRSALLLLAGFVVAASAVAGNSTTALWPDGSGHAHSDYTQHTGLGFGMSLLSFLSLGESVGEVDVKRDLQGKVWGAVALLSGGFALVDGTDPASPKLVSKSAGGGYGADVKMAEDTNTVFLSLQGGGSGCDISGEGPVVPPLPRKVQCGVQVWDTTDKAAPKFLVTLPSSSSGSHMMDYEVLNGVPTIAMAAQGSPNGVPIAVVGANKVPVTVGRAEAGFVHDVTLTADPLDPARSLAIVANWNSGVRVYDITAPALPILLGQWVPPAGSGGNVHTVMAMVVEGKRVIVAEQENFGQNVVSKLFFLDATNYGAMTLLGTWQNPDGRMANSGFVRWSTHNFNVADGKLYLAHYHGGVVVLDVGSLAKMANPPMLGNYLAAKPRTGTAFGSDIPYTWDAVPFAGVVWATDINTGLHIVKLD